MATLKFFVLKLSTGGTPVVWPPIGISPHGSTKVKIINRTTTAITVGHAAKLDTTADPFTVGAKQSTETSVKANEDVAGNQFRLDLEDVDRSKIRVMAMAADPEIIIT